MVARAQSSPSAGCGSAARRNCCPRRGVLAGVVLPGLVPAADRLLPIARSGPVRVVPSVANVAISAAVLVVLAAVMIDVLRSRRFAMTCAPLASAAGIAGHDGLNVLVRLSVGQDRTRMLTGSPTHSAVLPITVVLALLVGADLRHRRWWGASRLVVAATLGCALLLGSVTAFSATFAVLVGAVAGLGVLVAVGVVPARPSPEVIRTVLAGAGFELTALRPLEHPTGGIRYTGTGPTVGDIQVTVMDPDRGGMPIARRGWRLIRLTKAVVGRPALTLSAQLERQVLTATLAASAGVAAPHVLALLAAGPTLVLLEQVPAGEPLSSAVGGQASRGAEAGFAALRRLHDAGVAHGGLTADTVLLLPDGQVGFTDFGSAQPAATQVQRDLDVVALLVACAVTAGAPAASRPYAPPTTRPR